MFDDLRKFISALDDSGELIRVKERRSTRHEIPAAMKLIDQKQGKAVFLKMWKGTMSPT